VRALNFRPGEVSSLTRVRGEFTPEGWKDTTISYDQSGNRRLPQHSSWIALRHFLPLRTCSNR